MLYSQSDNITTTPSPVDTINSQVTSDNSLKPDASSYTGSPSIISGIQTYLQRVFLVVRPSNGSIHQVSSPNSISDKYHLQFNNITIKSNQCPTNTANLLRLRIIVMTGLFLPHCPQIIPSDLSIITNGKNTVNKKYTASPTSGDQLFPENLMTSTLPSSQCFTRNKYHPSDPH